VALCSFLLALNARTNFKNNSVLLEKFRLFNSSTVRKTTFLLAFGLVLSSAFAVAQDLGGVEQGIKPYGAYHGGDIDSISMENGKLTLHISLISYPQRGGKLHAGFSVVYSNPLYELVDNCLNQPPTCIPTAYTWNLMYPAVRPGAYPGNLGPALNIVPDFIPTVVDTPFFYTLSDPDGAVHQLEGVSTYDFISVDATGYRYSGSLDNTLTDRQGTRYTMNLINGHPENVTSIEDTNGNLITTNLNSDGTQILSWTDTLGRTLPWSFSSTSNYTGCTGSLSTFSASLWTPPGPSGGTSQFKFCYAKFPLSYSPPPPAICGTEPCTGLTGTTTQLQSIVLPNGQAWTFEFNNAGSLSQITLPTGGTISYQWGTNSTCLTTPPKHYSDPQSPAATSRIVNANDGAGNHTWKYALTWSSNGAQTIVTDPNQNDAVHTEGNLLGGSCSVYETELDQYSGSHTAGTLLKKTVTTYNHATDPRNSLLQINVVPLTITTTNSPNKISQVVKTYDSGVLISGSSTNAIYGNVLTEKQYDYGTGAHGPLLRSTSTQYLALSNNNYLNNNLLELPSQVAVFAGTPGTGACGANGASACTSYGYDGSTLASSGITTQRDSSPPSGTYRGNQTAVNRWLNTSSSSLTTTSVWFDTGMPNTVTDPNLNTTTYSYSGTFAGAYVTETQLPTTTDNGGTQHQHITYANYDFDTGLTTSLTDQNGKITTYGYDDMWRIHTGTYPDGGSETYTYDDTPPSISVQIQHTIDATNSTNEYDLYDGLGRQIGQIKANGETTPYDRVDTCYDAIGRKLSVSYPYQSSSTIAASCTTPQAGDTYSYDALNRVQQIKHSDGTTVLSSYAGAATDVSDEGTGNPNARVERVSQFDALGRMVSVCEVTGTTQLGSGGTPATCSGQDITNTGFLTSYIYDALGNLQTVTQGTLGLRSFTYDSLSRLITATNPESGTTCYGTYNGSTCVSGYDADGNLISRTRAAPNNVSGNVTTTYQYDALNRLTQRSYSDAVTLPALLGYDQSSITMGAQQFNISNSIGRLSWTCVLYPSSPYCPSMTAFSYDPMGRIAELWQANPVNSNNITVSYSYDFLGDETDRNLSGNDHTSTYNIGGRLTSFIATNYTDAFNPANLLTAVHYDAFGHITSGTLANGLTESSAYDSRGRLQAMGVGTGCTNGVCTTAKYSLGMTYFGNSNVQTASDLVNGNWTYAYDDFNRVSSAAATGQGCSWDYDRYGNRWHQNNNGNCPAPMYSFTGNNNRIDGGSYDAVGNLLNDGVHSYTYDAENRIVSMDGGAVTYAYDVAGQRTSKTVGGVLTDFIYDREGHMVLPSPAAPTLLEEYVAGMHLGTYIINSQHTDSIFYYDHADWLGTERARTDVNGNVCEKITSLPFGDNQNIVTSCGTGVGTQPLDLSPMHFTGKERDPESGLDNFGKRYHASTMGRFMTPDPIGIMKQKLRDPQQWNMYSHARNNPLRWIDPTGQYICQGTKQECTAVQKEIKKDLKSKDPNVRAAVDNYGPLSKKAGDKGDNGVTVKFGEQGHGGETQFTHDKTGVVVTMNSDVVIKGANATKNSDDDVQARSVVAHEGAHVKDYKSDIASGFDVAHDITLRASEHNAYGVTNDVLRESGRSPANGVDFSTPTGIDQFLRDTQPGMNLDVPLSTNTEPN